jgi:hypothetical protein
MTGGIMWAAELGDTANAVADNISDDLIAAIGGIAAALIAAVGLVVAARARRDDRARVDRITTAVGEPNGHGTIVDMIERVLVRIGGIEDRIRHLDRHGGQAFHRLRSTVEDDVARGEELLRRLARLERRLSDDAAARDTGETPTVGDEEED